jgi:lipid II:glycine glycyltransferase (peptidoglycan interpeptide bridge formation enzyme)
MKIKTITDKERNAFNKIVSHPLQSYEWGEFREKSGIKVIRKGFFDKDNLLSAFSLTIHPIPKTPFTIGYVPKGDLPTKELLAELKKIGKQERCIFIQLEPNVFVISSNSEKSSGDLSVVSLLRDDRFVPAAHPLFTRFTFVLDLTKSEEELLKNMHQKARYNIRVAQKHDVTIEEDNSAQAFAAYLQLTQETTTRQKFYAHTKKYHQTQWLTLPHTHKKDRLSSHLFVAKYQGKILTAWILFIFKNELYYPYGASSSAHKEVMASNLIMWEAIRFGKKLDLKTFDMWGAMGSHPDKKDPWYGFHSFKQKYNPKHVEFIGSYDLIINPLLYNGYKLADKLRWIILKMKS